MGATEAEMQAAEAARKTLWNAFLQQRIRLRGHLEGNLPADIDPLEMRQGGIKIFEGILEVFLTRKNGPCPMCGGKDRWRFTDIDGKGTWWCNGCRGGNGFALAM
jgi:formamidopyrimidine-DNA glycosylase